MGGGEVGPGEIKGSRFFSCSGVSVLFVVTVLPLNFLSPPWTLLQPSSPVLLNHPDLLSIHETGWLGVHW